MEPLYHVDTMLSEYHSVYKHNNFSQFQAFVQGLIYTPYRGTMKYINQQNL